MRKYIALAVCLLVASPAFAQSSHYVSGHVTKNGTYVAPHYQTNPDSTKLNNWSTQGNVNPYSGKVGTIDPYAQQPSYSQPKTSYGYQAPLPPCYFNCPN
jgi:hypothetical protein